ncbi:hypothetical protein N335_13703, partial [Phaethon lepturus]
QAMGPEGPTRITAPFSMNDLDMWKEVVKNYRDDPTGVAKRFELVVKNQDPDWKDIDLVLDAMTETENQLVVKTAQTHVEALTTAGPYTGGVDNHVPLTNTSWDPNDRMEYKQLKSYQQWIKFGLGNGIPRSVNWSKLYEVKQGQDEMP